MILMIFEKLGLELRFRVRIKLRGAPSALEYSFFGVIALDHKIDVYF